MAGTTKFVSFDGEISISEKVMKIQNREEEAVIIPLQDVYSVRVRSPSEDSDGFIRVEDVDGRCFRIVFGEDDLDVAFEFMDAFSATFPDKENQPPAT